MNLKPPGFLNVEALKKVAEKHSKPYWWKGERRFSLSILEQKVNRYKDYIVIFIGKEADKFVVWEENVESPGFMLRPSRWTDLGSAFSDYSRRAANA